MKTRIYKIVAWISIAMGFLLLGFEMLITKAMADHSVFYLEKIYGQNRPQEYTYEHLFSYAQTLTAHRNSLVFFYQSIIVIMLIGNGILHFIYCKKMNVASQTSSTQSNNSSVQPNSKDEVNPTNNDVNTQYHRQGYE